MHVPTWTRPTHHLAQLDHTVASILVSTNWLGDFGRGLDLQLLLNL